MSHHTSVLIIGSGPAGYSAAIYAARALLKPILITGMQQGGQLMITTEVENYPGFAKPIQGPDLMEQMAAQAEEAGTNILFDTIIQADLSKYPYLLKGDSGEHYRGDTLIIATGAQARWLDIPGEQKFLGRGVSACATCDGFFYRGRDVVVIGGGNMAVEEALYLSHIARSVTLIHRRNELRAEKILQTRLFERSNIKILWDHVVEEIVGEAESPGNPEMVTGVIVKNLRNEEIYRIETLGVFVAIGHNPAVALFEGQLQQKAGGYLWTKADSTATNLPGVFAAGDVTDDVYRQAVTAAGRGCMAALEAERFLNLQLA